LYISDYIKKGNNENNVTQSFKNGVCLCNGCNEIALKKKCQTCKDNNYFCEVHKYHTKHRNTLFKPRNNTKIITKLSTKNNDKSMTSDDDSSYSSTGTISDKDNTRAINAQRKKVRRIESPGIYFIKLYSYIY
jgi:hypothetical protein